MKIETLEVAGLKQALKGMRNPMNSWDKSDSAWNLADPCPCLRTKPPMPKRTISKIRFH